MAVSEKLRKKLLKRKETLKKGSGDFNTIIFKEGTTRIRPLFVGEDEDFAQEVIQFFLGGDLGVVISPATFGEPCAIMEAYEELKSGDEDDKVLAQKIRPTRRYYCPAIKYEDETGKAIDGKPRMAILTKGIYETMIEYMLDEEQGDFTDPIEGYDLKIKRTGSGKMDTEYQLIACKPTKLSKELAGQVFNPEDMVRDILPSYDQTKEMLDKFLGLGNSEDDEDEAPKKKTKAKPSSDLDDEDEAPKKKVKKKIKLRK